MDIVVQKFGGTSVSTEENRLMCLKHVEREIQAGHKIVVVVSAIGRSGDPYATDTLLSLLEDNKKHVHKREMDLLLSTGELISASVFSSMLHKHHITNTVLTGGQAGIITNDDFNNAKIIALTPNKVLESFKTSDVVVVAGFQGVTENGEITTLGRGGSDTSATALGVALNAKFVDIFTDVDGIFTADPRIVSEAKSLSFITYNEISNLAHLGAKVIHPRAVDMAMHKSIPIRVRSTFSNFEGTLISNGNEMEGQRVLSERLITGITQTPNLVQLKINKEECVENFPLNIFDAMKENSISVDLINVSIDQVVYTVSKEDGERARVALEALGYHPILGHDFTKVSIVGANIAGVPGVMAQIIEALNVHSIPIYQSADSHTTIWLLIKSEHMVNTICSLHDKFRLNNAF